MMRLSSHPGSRRRYRLWTVLSIAAMASLTLSAVPATADIAPSTSEDSVVDASDASCAPPATGMPFLGRDVDVELPSQIAPAELGCAPVGSEGLADADSASAGSAAPIEPFPCKEEPGYNDACPDWVADVRPTEQRAIQAHIPTTHHAVSPDGRLLFVAVGTLYKEHYPGPFRYEPGVVALETESGSVVWQKDYYEGTDEGEEPEAAITGLAVSPDGRVVYATAVLSAPKGSDIHGMVLALDAATGELLWERQPVAKTSYFLGLAVSADGAGLAVTGIIFDWDYYYSVGHRKWSMVTAVLDAASGATRWVDVVDGTGGGVQGYKIVAAPEGAAENNGAAFYVAGVARRADEYGQDLLSWAYGATGRLLWVHRHPRDSRQNPPRDFQITPDGQRLVSLSTLFRYDETGEKVADEALIVAVDARSGDEVWHSAYAADPGPTTGFISSLALDPNGKQAYVTADVCCGPAIVDPPGVNPTDRRYGLLGGSSETYVDTVAYRMSDGSQVWTARLKDALTQKDGYVAVNPMKPQVQVAAQARDGGCCIGYYNITGIPRWAATVTYDSTTGQKIASNRYHDPWYSPTSSGIVSGFSNLKPLGLAVHPDGHRVFPILEANQYRNGVGAAAEFFTRVLAYDTPE